MLYNIHVAVFIIIFLHSVVFIRTSEEVHKKENSTEKNVLNGTASIKSHNSDLKHEELYMSHHTNAITVSKPTVKNEVSIKPIYNNTNHASSNETRLQINTPRKNISSVINMKNETMLHKNENVASQLLNTKQNKSESATSKAKDSFKNMPLTTPTLSIKHSKESSVIVTEGGENINMPILPGVKHETSSKQKNVTDNHKTNNLTEKSPNIDIHSSNISNNTSHSESKHIHEQTLKTDDKVKIELKLNETNNKSGSVKKKKPLFTMLTGDKSSKDSESFIESPTTGRDYVLPIVLVILSLPIIGYIIKLIYRRGTEFTERQQYHRMYLIDDVMEALRARINSYKNQFRLRLK